jgi:hypothetical protein
MGGSGGAIDLPAPRLLRDWRGGGIDSPVRPPPLVLLIDDRDTRLLYSGILRDEGVVVAQAGDGQDGLGPSP